MATSEPELNLSPEDQADIEAAERDAMANHMASCLIDSYVRAVKLTAAMPFAQKLIGKALWDAMDEIGPEEKKVIMVNFMDQIVKMRTAQGKCPNPFHEDADC